MIDIYWQPEPGHDCPWEVLETAPVIDARILSGLRAVAPAGTRIEMRREAERWFIDIVEADTPQAAAAA